MAAYRIGASKIHGEGVIATQLLPAGYTIGLAIKAQPLSTTRMGSKVNHSRTPNAELYKDGNGWFLRLTRPVRAGDEITADYNDAPGFVKRPSKKWDTQQRKEAASGVLYHGSPDKLDIIEPRDTHGDPGVGARVFASPYQAMALAYLGKKWGDRDINQGMEDDRWYLREMRPGALKDIYGNQTGYLHTLKPDTFEDENTKGGVFEATSKVPVKPVTVRRIKDILRALRRAKVDLIPFNPEDQGYAEAVQRMRTRLLQMSPEQRKQHLRWVAETNPDLAAKMQEKTVADAQQRKEDASATAYSPPYGIDRLKRIKSKLLDCPVHRWRAEQGIELIHREPDLPELQRIWANWQLMTPEQKAISELKSMELFGRTNEEHYKALLPLYEKTAAGRQKTADAVLSRALGLMVE